MGCDLMCDRHLLNQGHSHINISELKVKALLVILHVSVLVDSNGRVSSNNVLNILINEVVEWVDMLFDEAANPQECWH